MHNISSFLHPPIFPLIPPPPSTALRRFPFPPFLFPSFQRKEKKNIFPFPFPAFSYSPPPFCLPPPSFLPPLFIPSFTSPLFPLPSNFIPLFLLSFLPSSPSFKICESYPPPPSVSSFPIHYFSPFPLSIYLPFPPPPPSSSLPNKI